VMGVLGGMAATPANLVSLIARIPEGSVWQVIGIGRHNLAMTSIGLAMGGNARTGMEDTLLVRRGQPTTGNGELTERLAATATALDRPPATVDQASERLQLGQTVSRVATTS
jgi:3-keto-5-aminohexanoate cleavage enzyme